MAKAKGFTKRYGPLNPAPASEVVLDERGQPHIALTTTLMKSLAQLLEDIRGAARAELNKAGIGSSKGYNNETMLNIMNACGESVEERHRRLASLPANAAFAFGLDASLDILDWKLESGDAEASARAALFVGLLAGRLHALPWEPLAMAELFHRQWVRKPLSERQKLGARKGQKKRWRDYNETTVAHWKEQAETIWSRDARLSISAVARAISETAGGNVDTIRRRIRNLRPTSEQ